VGQAKILAKHNAMAYSPEFKITGSAPWPFSVQLILFFYLLFFYLFIINYKNVQPQFEDYAHVCRELHMCTCVTAI